jgi:hypothetical protein
VSDIQTPRAKPTPNNSSRSKDYTPAIIWLNVIAVPMYVIVACVIYHLSGQYVVSPALGSAPGTASKVAYGILFPTLLGSGLVFGHTGIKYMYNVVMDKVIKSRHRLTDNTPLTWGVWLGLGTAFWLVAFVLANAIPAFGSILAISSALFVTWFTFGMANAQWIFLNWGGQFSSWKKTLLALFNWFMILGKSVCFFLRTNCAFCMKGERPRKLIGMQLRRSSLSLGCILPSRICTLGSWTRMTR